MLAYTKGTKVVLTQPEEKWHLLDAKDFVLGRLATKVAELLIGKNKTAYAPHIALSDNVVIINSDLITITGRKAVQKEYKRYSGYPGGLTTRIYQDVVKQKSEEVIRKAIMGMLPKNKLRAEMICHLFIYKGEENPQKAKFTDK
ncbi:MAG: 50S ribosomal protein L13 [Candidatus Roizmanbacteria bacterium]